MEISFNGSKINTTTNITSAPVNTQRNARLPIALKLIDLPDYSN